MLGLLIIFLLVLPILVFLYCSLKISSKCSREEERRSIDGRKSSQSNSKNSFK